MKIAFIKKRYIPYGGAENYLHTTLNILKKSGHELHIFAQNWIQEEGVSFHPINVPFRGSLFSSIYFNKRVKEELSMNSFDCVVSFERTTLQDIYRAGDGCHAEWLSIRKSFETLLKRASLRINPFHIYTRHLERNIFRNTRLIIANSCMVKRQIMGHYGIPEDRIVVLYNGVNIERFHPGNREKWRAEIRKGLGLAETEKLILFVGSDFKRKGLAILIESIGILKKGGYNNLKLLVTGRGNIRRYKLLCARHGIEEKTIFNGSQKEIEKIYAGADLFVLPTLYDPFSNATLEAMASGLPVITTENNGASELIENGTEGYMLKYPLSVSDLADKIYLSLEKLEEMGMKGRKRAEQLSIEEIINKFLRLIMQTCGERTTTF